MLTSIASSIAGHLGLTSLYQKIFSENESSEHAKETPKKRTHSPPSSPPTAKKTRASCNERSSNAIVNSQWHSNWQAERKMCQQRITHSTSPIRPDRPMRSDHASPIRSGHQAGPMKPDHQARPMKPHQAGPMKPHQAGPMKPHQAGPMKPHQAGPMKPHQAGPMKPHHQTGLTRPDHQTGLTRPDHQTGLTRPDHQTGLTRPDHQTGLTRPDQAGAMRPDHQAMPTRPDHQAGPMRPDGASGTSYGSSVTTPSQQPAMRNRTKPAKCIASWEPAGGYLLSGGTPLLFFYDCESTGGSIHDDHIIEIAAEVVGPEEKFVTIKSFSELCFTSRIIQGIGCDVNESMLVGTREFSYVFLDFLLWVNNCIIEVKKAYGKPFYPVLVAHNGFNFDYRILAAEIERRKLGAQFIKADLGFADTLYELRKLKKTANSILSGWSTEEQRHLNMDSLHKKCFPEENRFRTHRALEDVRMMVKIFISSNQFNSLLQSLTVKNVTEIITDWKTTHEEFILRNEAQSLYGAGTSKAMAKCLKQNQLSYEVLQEMFRRCPSLESFDKMTRDSGVKNKTWRQQLWEHFSRH